jgi:demethylmenaquinone methyltransferase/2-methoxy-6-polyprenyl-1,4-benzoquinol methylase
VRCDLLVFEFMTSPRSSIVSAPHPPLTAYYGEESARRTWVRDIFNRTATDYDRVESAMSVGLGAHYRRVALLRAGLAPGMHMLDVGTGTGLVAKQALRIVGESGTVTGVDPGIGMLAAGELSRRIRAVAAMGERLPLADEQFDFVSMGYALRHVSDIAAVFAEFHRVLKPGGRLCVLEITPPQGRAWAALLTYAGSAARSGGRAPCRYGNAHALLLGYDRDVRAAERADRRATGRRFRARGAPCGARHLFRVSGATAELNGGIFAPGNSTAQTAPSTSYPVRM